MESRPNANDVIVIPADGNPARIASAAPKLAPDDAPKTSGIPWFLKNTLEYAPPLRAQSRRRCQ